MYNFNCGSYRVSCTASSEGVTSSVFQSTGQISSGNKCAGERGVIPLQWPHDGCPIAKPTIGADSRQSAECLAAARGGGESALHRNLGETLGNWHTADWMNGCRQVVAGAGSILCLAVAGGLGQSSENST
jgi:hypothetical protein